MYSEGAIAEMLARAAACGYQVGISLRPSSPEKRAFSAVFGGVG
jgi:hypothetical protein